MPLGRIQAEMTGETPKGGLQTNNAFRLHTDRCDVISLLSLRAAPSGGASRVCSAPAIFNATAVLLDVPTAAGGTATVHVMPLAAPEPMDEPWRLASTVEDSAVAIQLLTGAGHTWNEATLRVLARPPSRGVLYQQERKEEKKELKQELLDEGFASWGKRDFLNFVRANADHGWQAIAEIAAEMDGKSVAEVRRYAAVFWERGPDELADWDKHVARM